MIPAHPTLPPNFSVESKFPNLPTLTKLSAEDLQSLIKWWADVQIVLQRQFAQVASEISDNTTNITTLIDEQPEPASAPTGVTVGTTPVDKWFALSSGGKTYMLPGWLNH